MSENNIFKEYCLYSGVFDEFKVYFRKDRKCWGTQCKSFILEVEIVLELKVILFHYVTCH